MWLLLLVNCPGVWICSKGMIYLDMCIFGQNYKTSLVNPKFPMHINETFSLHNDLIEIFNLYEVQRYLEEHFMLITLIQVYEEKLITLATFKARVDQVLYPTSNLSIDGKTSLLMNNEPIFPGIIAPKVVVVTKTDIYEELNSLRHDNFNSPEIQHCFKRRNKVHHAKLQDCVLKKHELFVHERKIKNFEPINQYLLKNRKDHSMIQNTSCFCKFSHVCYPYHGTFSSKRSESNNCSTNLLGPIKFSNKTINFDEDEPRKVSPKMTDKSRLGQKCCKCGDSQCTLSSI
ncbi:spermatogenesis-associated protein 6 isoform X2 [Daktulosphaira vitifoliae]|uniref:spermatogenesis-associated protein 6 isoform X2 n=1 Tax=Daktulosphaira vitifoliae TaxID=58002 RepID=UPI0021AAE072|nr:spermatogenesis-associated protein 6 isoform X2 [Daktulosphaira vitifoliae]